MSDLTNLEKKRFEKLFDMSGGYVLDFSNRTIAEFVVDSTGRNIYDVRYDYESGSKANRLRAFWQVEDNRVVGKLMGDMLDYGVEGGFFKAKEAALLDGCRQIVARLLQNVAAAAPARNEPTQNDLLRRRTETLSELKQEFFRLADEPNRNAAGFAFEKLLNRLFALFSLQPRQPFRVVGEQIDGSFELEGQIYLLESKWEKHPLPEADLLIFRGKIEGKSTFTRGVFIALHDISDPAREAITRGKAPSFFVVNGHDLLMILSEEITLTDFLKQRIRLLGEEGRVSVPFRDLAKSKTLV